MAGSVPTPCRSTRPAVVVLVVVAVVVVAVVTVWVAALVRFRGWIAHNDFAIFRIALELELGGDVRTVGAFSRLGVFHPGPLREWVFVVPYWLSGRSAAALPATALVLNAVWTVWTAVVVRRLGGWVAPAGMAALALVVVAVGPDLASPWNPHLAILPLHLACWAVVDVIAHSGRSWVAAIASASFAAQLHASALVVGGGVLAAALVALVVHRRDGRRAGTTLAGAAALAVLLWSGPLADLRRGREANLVRMLRAGSDGESVGPIAALGHVARLVWPRTPLTGYAVRPTVEVFAAFGWWWLLVVVAGLAAVWAVTSEPAERVAVGVAAGALAVTAVTVALFVEPPFRYLYGPLQAPAVFCLVVLVGGLVAAAARRWAGVLAARSLTRGAGAVVAGAVVVASVGVVVVELVTVPVDDHETAGRRELGVEATVSGALDRHPEWTEVAVVGLDLRHASIDAEVADVAMRSGLGVRSWRFGLGVPPPDGHEPILAAAMGAARECLLAAPGGVEPILDGELATTGDAVAIFVVADPDAATGCVTGIAR